MNRRSILQSLFGGFLTSAVPVSPQAIQGSVMLAEPLKLAKMTLDTTLINKAVNAALQSVKFSLPDGSFMLIPPLTSDEEDDTIGCVASSG